MIFIVDDDEGVRNSLRLLLECEGFAAREFASAELFLALARPADGDCLILDLHMPGDGRPQSPSGAAPAPRWVPVIVISGRMDTAARSRARAAGAIAIVEKPYGCRSFSTLFGWRWTLEDGQPVRPRREIARRSACAGSPGLAGRAARAIVNNQALQPGAINDLQMSPIPEPDKTAARQGTKRPAYRRQRRPDIIRDIRAGHREIRSRSCLFPGLLIAIEHLNEHRHFGEGAVSAEHECVALRLSQLVAKLAQQVALEGRVSQEQTFESRQRQPIDDEGRPAPASST